MDAKEIKVGIGDLNVALPPDRIVTLGLGSCVGIAIYDSQNKVAGLAHIMLPDSKSFTNQKNLMKFPDQAIPELINRMVKLGGNISYFKAKIAGGASMFGFSDKNPAMNIGARNGEAVKVNLKQYNIPIRAEDLGGNSGRTMIIEAATGKVLIKMVGHDIKEL